MSDPILFRCHSIGYLMTEPVSVDDALRTPEIEEIIAKKKRTDEEKALLAEAKEKTLSVTAKTYIRKLVAQDIFGVEFEIGSKQIEKGLIMEDASIALLARVRGLTLKKNTTRKTNGFLSGEADIFREDVRVGNDVKTAWSFGTFPILPIDAFDKMYEWQMRGYMMLWDAEQWEVNHCLVNTPEHLIGFEPQSMHFVDHIPEHMRVTSWIVTRDRSIEDSILRKVAIARDYYKAVAAEFDQLHQKRA